ncbi:CPA_1a_G0016930.mRNA.1.CDS.1 [Saccharomyces cerevisiae]|nr:CPA_1a_G0016930.mRNA.1.CDS.1 [Saccharomyces cerevisiae]CAI7275198.1 CPA_1a_G0016930.mRNA.1.CDS.1 [Saccharomyces cerevisiae]
MSKKILTQITQLPPDPLFHILRRMASDSRPNKTDLGIGAYRDDYGDPWVLPSVRAAERMIHEDPNYNHEYLDIAGLPDFISGAAKVILGPDSRAISEGRTISMQSLSGTGALHVAAKFLSKFIPEKVVYLSDPTWVNHNAIFESAGMKTATYPYWNPSSKSLNLNSLLRTIHEAPSGSIFVLHACAHNPTGLDPTEGEWNTILDHMVSKKHITLFDSAYQGFASGNLDNDAFSVRLAINKLSNISPVFICQSFAKNIGMYGQRVGCFHLVLQEDSSENIKKVRSALASQLVKITRSEISNPPSYGAKIVSKILNTPELTLQWHKDMITMSSRMNEMRSLLHEKLVEMKTPGKWNHIKEQCGMFSYTGLSADMVQRLENKHAIYMLSSGRASIAGLNDGNVAQVATAIDEVVRKSYRATSP